MRLLDVRHEQTAAFAAEATGKLTRVPGLAVLTAGPGVTNGVSADRPGPVRRVADGRRRGARARQPLGQRQPPGARPAADPRVRLQAGPHPAHRRGRPRRDAPGVHDGPLLPPRTGVRGRPDGRVLQLGVRAGPGAVRGPRRRARPGRRHRDRRAARRLPPAGARARHRRVGRRRGGGGAALRRGRRDPHHHQRDGPRRRAGRSPAAGDQGPRQGPRHQRPGGRRRDPAGLPARVRRLRGRCNGFRGERGAGAGRARRRLPRPGLGPRRPRGVRLRRPHRGARRPAGRPGAGRAPPGLVRLGRRPPGHRGRRDRAGRRPAGSRGRPDPPGPHLRRAGPPTRRGRGRHRGRRRLRQLRGQVRRAPAARRLARPGSLRLPGRRPGRRDRGAAGPTVRAGGAAARRRRRRLLPDGRRHAGAPRPARGDGHGQQLRVGPGEGPDADALRLRRGRRPRAADGVRRGGARARRRPARR